MDSAKHCRSCSSELEVIIDYGLMPIANAFVVNNYVGPKFNLIGSVCPKCWLFQLVDQPDAAEMFHENYAFITGTSKFMVSHFEETAKSLKEIASEDLKFVVEIGSNDGTHLKNYISDDCRVLGVEPSKNVCDLAIADGINSIPLFFSKESAEEILKEYGKADLIYASNVICHIPNIISIAQGVNSLLSDNGMFVFEDPYLLSMVQKGTYDQLYDEHVFMFSVTSVQNIFKPYGLELFDCQKLDTHGGSMRYFLAKENSRELTPRLQQTLQYEKDQNLDNIHSYLDFAEKCSMRKNELYEIINNFKKEGKKIIGYGATSKSTTILNYCDLSKDHIDYIVDNTPTKIDKRTPITDIPIKDRDFFLNDKNVDAIVLFAWNHAKEIMLKESKFTSDGGIWIDIGENIGVIDDPVCKS